MKTVYKVLAADIILLVAAFYVAQDLDWRASYAASPHAACYPNLCSYSASYAYSLLTRSFTMAGNGVTLTSPPTFDWLQALIVVLVALNGWFAYRVLESRKSRTPAAAVA